VAFLAANLALAALAAALALGASDRLAVAGGLDAGADERGGELVVVLRQGTQVGRAATREAGAVIRSGLLSDPAVRSVKPLETGLEGNTVLVVGFATATARESQLAAERVAARVDPGPFEVLLGGEPMVQVLARDRVESKLPRLAALAAPFILLVVWFGFGIRHAFAPLLAAATGALGGIAVLRLLPAGLDLPGAGVAVAAAVGIAVGIEACFAIRRGFAQVPPGGPESLLAGCLRISVPRVAWATLGAALAAVTLLGLALPAARSAALGGVAAALLAGASALFAMTGVLALSPAPVAGGAGSEGRGLADRLRDGSVGGVADELAVRPGLAWIPALLVAAALGLAASHAFDASALAFVAGDLPGNSDPARVAELFARDLPVAQAERLASGSGRVAEGAAELFRARLPWIAALITIAGLLAAYAATRSLRLGLARGIGAALPSTATCGLLVLAAEGSLPFELDLLEGAPHASVLFAVLAAVGAVSVARSALGNMAAALAGTLVAGAALGVLAGVGLDAVGQLGVAVATGLVLDLIAVRAILAPALERALPTGPLTPPRLPRLRLPDRLRR